MTNKKKKLGEDIMYAIKAACELNGIDSEKLVIKIVLADVEAEKTQPMTLIGSKVLAGQLQEIEFAMLTSHMRAVATLYPGSVEIAIEEATTNETKH